MKYVDEKMPLYRHEDVCIISIIVTSQFRVITMHERKNMPTRITKISAYIGIPLIAPLL